MPDDYSIADAFQRIEDELIRSMIRNLDRHRAEEEKEEILWSQWQTEQLKALEEYKFRNQKKYGKEFKSINSRIEQLIKIANKEGGMEQEAEILEAIKNGFTGYRKGGRGITATFFRTNERKLDALIQATTQDMERAETAILRMANDKYRKVIYSAQVYANTGAGTYEKAVDMATKDMLEAGLNCIEYKNGARHTLPDYADMAIRTASKRAYLQGEGTKRQEWGIHTVIMNKRGNPCPKCLPFCGKILIDDVWSGGSSRDGPYPLMSSAIAAGLYHPRCKDSHTTYFPGISTLPDDKFTRKEIAEIEQNTEQEIKQQYAERQVKKFGRMAEFSLDSDNRKQYAKREDSWKEVAEEENRDIMELTETDLGAILKYKSPDSYTINSMLRDTKDIEELETVQKKFVKELDEALAKVPKYEGNLLRTVDFKAFPDSEERLNRYLDTFEVGKIRKSKQYVSTSKRIGYDEEADVKIYIQDSKNGRDISNIGLDEGEVLYERNASFQVVAKEQVGKVWYILLKEVT